MFHIIALAVTVLGSTHLFVSDERYPTKAECELAMPQRLSELKTALEEKNPDFKPIEVGGKCDMDGQPA